MSVKNSNDTIGNRTRDLPACSAVPQPTALPRVPLLLDIFGLLWNDLQQLRQMDKETADCAVLSSL